MSCPIKVDPLTPAINLGKGPHWDSKSQSLYCVDMFKGTVHCYKPECDAFTSATVGCGDQPLAIIVPVEGKDETFVVSMKNDLSCIKWDGVSCKTSDPQVIQNLEPNDNSNRINNGKVDPRGRLWAGTTGKRVSDKELIFEEGVAGLYILRDCKTADKILDKVTVANGMEWSCDRKKFFFADSNKYQLEAYDYCDEAGKICNPCTIFNLKEKNVCGLLDAMTMDCDGKLYIANYMGCQVVVIDPNTCQIVNQIKIPAKEVTSVCWGGPNNDVLFVTTGNTEPNPKYPCAGRVFKVCNIGAKGVPCRNVVLQ